MRTLTIFALMLAAGLMSCEINPTETIYGNGDTDTKTVEISDYQSVEMNGAYQAICIQDSTWMVEVEAESNLLPLIDVYTSGTTLVIENKDGYEINTDQTIIIKIHHQGLEAFHLNGSGTVDLNELKTNTFTCGFSGTGQVNGNIEATSLDITFSGTGDLNTQIQCEEVEASISGTGNMNLEGRADKGYFTISGTGVVMASKLSLKNCQTEISGIGTEQFSISETFNITVSGLATIDYWGSPELTQHITGTAVINHH